MRTTYATYNPRLIQDVIPYNQRFRQPGLQWRMNMSIGELDAEWRRRQSLKRYHGMGYTPRPVRPVVSRGRYTYVPPRSINQRGTTVKSAGIYASYWWTRLDMKVIEPVIVKTKRACQTLVAVPMAILSFSTIKSLAKKFQLFPKKYTAAKGLFISLDTRTLDLTKKMAAPLACMLGVCAILVASWQPVNPYSPNVTHYAKPVAASTPSVGQSPANSGGQASKGVYAASTSQTTPVTPTYTSSVNHGTASNAVNSSNSSTGIAAGKGGSSTGGSIPGVTTPEPVTVGGTTVGSGDKTVASTSPVTVTLN